MSLGLPLVTRDFSALAGMGDASRASLEAEAEEVRLDAGEILFSDGDPGDYVYFIASGSVKIVVSLPSRGELVLAALGAGEIVGEHFLFQSGGKGFRGGGAQALEPTLLHRVAGNVFLNALKANPDLYARLRGRWEEREASNLAKRSRMFDLLRGLPAAEPGNLVSFAEGEVVFRQGDVADAAYFVIAGRISIYPESNPDAPLAEVEAGHCFGEKALIRDQPRAASAKAIMPVSAIRLVKSEFVALYEQSSELRDMLEGLEFAYRMPKRGVVLNYPGRQGDTPSLERFYRLEDGRRILSYWVPSLKIFRMERLLDIGSPDEDGAEELEWADAADPARAERRRSVKLGLNGQILGLFGAGEWPQLPWLIEYAVDGIPLTREALRDFVHVGRIERPSEPAVGDETACFCMQVKVAKLRDLIAQGHGTLDSLRQETSCCSVCGGCEPMIQSLLGNNEWIPVRATAEPLTDDIRAFRLRPELPGELAWKTGQHVVLSGRIGDVWISRCYTITSVPGTDLEIAVNREPQGVFSRWLFEGEVAIKELRIARPRGEAVWEPSFRPTVCLVAGIGVTPAISIVRAARTAKPVSRVHVDYSGRRKEEMAFLEELGAGPAGAITLNPRLTRFERRLDKEATGVLVRQFPNADYFVCGPLPFMDATVGFLNDAGVPPGRIREERFVHAGGPIVHRDTSPPKRAGFIRSAYVAGLAVATVILLLFNLPITRALLPTGPHNTGHASLDCTACHRDAPGTMRQQLQAIVHYSLGTRTENASFQHLPVDNSACNGCHSRPDSHASHLFMEARYNEIRDALGPHRCVSCHKEHRGVRVTLADGRYCASCHADMNLKKDALIPPAAPTHAELTKAGKWSSCMGCHDYHGNHTLKTATAMSQSASEEKIKEYLRGGLSPYGTEVKVKARTTPLLDAERSTAK